MFKALDSFQSAIVELGIARPKLIIMSALVLTIVLLVALVLRVEVDTDPENMLSSSNPAQTGYSSASQGNNALLSAAGKARVGVW